MRFWAFLVLVSFLALVFAAPKKQKEHESGEETTERSSEGKHSGGKFLKHWAKKLKKTPLLPPPPPPLYPMVQPLFMTLPFYVQSPRYQFVPVPIETPAHVKGYYGGGTTGYVNGPLGMNQNGPPPV
ncbi:unnamed protein product [Allacma fusca]|uniref:Uncharacterized protein n=1 Tax=Allacma fusca TaxID=39272 RepID=A0A8J2PR35_9HEXA|nr:unnamed protein product [Allacma fusca]